MKQTDEIRNSFEDLKTSSLRKRSSIYDNGLWAKWHELADMKYQPAKEFFIERLQDARGSWRKESISFLGFHYILEKVVLEKIRDLLTSDPESGVRIAAAAALGKQSKLPEKSLILALINDTNKYVKEAAFSALLELADIPYKIKIKELGKVESGEILPSLDQVKRILLECGKMTSIDLIKQ